MLVAYREDQEIITFAAYYSTIIPFKALLSKQNACDQVFIMIL